MSPIDTVLAAAQRCQQAGTPYALVSVIRALPPASARPGDKAVVTADGQLQGWVGGGCAQPAVIRTVRLALQDGQARLIRISPSDERTEKALGDVLEFGMSCHSGGTLELFIDPVLPREQLVVIGDAPVAQALSQLAGRVGFGLTVVAHEARAATYPDADRVLPSDDPAQVLPQVAPGAWVVVATQGRRDVQGLRLALALQARQVAFVASARKAEVLKASLRSAGADAAAVDAIVAPAGLHMDAVTPAEIALSVLAAVVQQRRRAAAPAELAPVAGDAPAEAPAAAPVPELVEAAAPKSCCGGAVADLPPLPPVRSSSCCGN